jgi:hypothetical protein
MLTSKALGEAIRAALIENKKSPADAARFFGVKPPSVSGWMTTGRISKTNFEKLVNWLVLTPRSHWGLTDSTKSIDHQNTATANLTAPSFQASASGGLTLPKSLGGIQKSLDGSDGSTQKIALILIGDMLAGTRTAENVASAIDAMLKTAAPLEMPTETNQIVTKALAK